MANIDRFMIAPINSGMETDVKPFLIPDDAFEELVNAYVFRGRVIKRFGSTPMNLVVDQAEQQLHTRVRINVGTTAAATGDLPLTTMPGTVGAIGQMFSIGDTIFTVHQPAGATYTTGAATATYDTVTRNLVVTGNNENPLTPVYFYPATPIMGLLSYETAQINNEPAFAFDTQFAYQYVAGGWERLGTATWTGTDSQFFWGCNYRGANEIDFSLFVMNYNSADLIKYWNGATWNAVPFSPILTNAGTTTLRTARCAVWFKKRLLFLNTIERFGGIDKVYSNRIRFSAVGVDAVSANAFVSDIPGKGGFIDASTKEQIISCGFIRDRLIVYFERSTWEVVYTNIDTEPFVYQKINTELGVESTFSVVPFDKALLGMGNVGVHACTGANVDRIDQKIPNEVFDISNQNAGVERVCGVRDYYAQMVYWAFNSGEFNSIYPDKVLVFNYINKTWALNEDSITAFGYYQKQTSLTWASWHTPWNQSTWAWNSGSNIGKFRNTIAGNQQGFTFIICPIECSSNAAALSITDISMAPLPSYDVTITAINHNLKPGEYVLFENVSGITGINDKIYRVGLITPNTFIITNTDQNPGNPQRFVGAYTGGGTLARVSNIHITTKQYNFYMDKGYNAYVSKVDFFLERCGGQVQVDYFVGSSTRSMLVDGTTTNSLISTSILETSAYALAPYEQSMDRFWHPLYFQADGECIQLKIYMNEGQMLDPDIALVDFQLHAMTFYATPTSSRLQ